MIKRRRYVSIPSNGSIQFLPYALEGSCRDYILVSIPSNGSIQFLLDEMTEYEQEMETKVSIPSNGSIQFLHCQLDQIINSIDFMSQSPQTGQFNSSDKFSEHQTLWETGLNPVKRVNSILTSSIVGLFA